MHFHKVLGKGQANSTKKKVMNAQTFFTVNRRKKEGYLTHGVDALTEASDEGRRRLR